MEAQAKGFFCHCSFSSLVSSSGSGKKTKPLYKRKPQLICVRAFQNGNRDNYARITAPDLKQVWILYSNCLSYEKVMTVNFLFSGFIYCAFVYTKPQIRTSLIGIYFIC